MSMFNIGTRNTGPLPPIFTTPAAAPVSAPSEQPAAAPGAASDQNQVQAQTPPEVDMGPLPWETAAEEVTGPEAAFMNTPEFKQLSETDQATLKTFFETTIQGKGADKAEEMANRLGQLLTQGKLADKDAFGQGILDHLAAFNQASLHPSVSRTTSKDQLARELLTNLADPASLTQAPGTLHCAEATLEATLAYTQPADYARIATELMTKGEARIPGPPRGPNPDSLKLASPHGMRFGSAELSSLMQDAFEARVANRNTYSYEDGGPAGLDAHQVKALYDGIVGSDHLTLYANRGTNLLPAIGKALEDQGAVKVTMQSEDGLHSVAVLSASDKEVAIWDPATGKGQTLSVAEFNSLVVRATLDSKHVDQDTARRQQMGHFGGVRQWEEGGNYEEYQREGGGRLGRRAQYG